MLKVREEEILLSLKKYDYLNVRQFQRLHNLKGTRNAYRVINQLEPYMSVFKDNGVNVYYLNKKGREVTNATKTRRKLTTAKHYIMRNDLCIHLGCPKTWRNEMGMRFKSNNEEITMIADAYFKNDKHNLVEIDNMQKMGKNKIKIDKYRRLIQKGVFKGMPRLYWVTTTPYRYKILSELCEGLDATIYMYNDFK